MRGRPLRASPPRGVSGCVSGRRTNVPSRTRGFSAARRVHRSAPFAALQDRQPLGLTGLRVPVLLLWGTKDVILLPRQGRRFERLIPGAELRYLKGLGHTPMSDDPGALVKEISEFALRRSPVPRAAAPA